VRTRSILRRPSPRDIDKVTEAALRAAAGAAARRYGSHSNVLAVSAGIKHRAKRQQDELCVQFFVKRKQRRPTTRKLPRFVYGVRRRRIDRSIKFLTDVIEVGYIKAGCGAGARTRGLGEIGTTTLLFRNKIPSSEISYFILSCAHVIGDLTTSPPVNRPVTSPTCTAVRPFAVVLKNGTADQGVVEYDLAVARVTEDAVRAMGRAQLDAVDCRVFKRGVVLNAFAPAQTIRPGLPVECVGAESGHGAGTVQSYASTFPVRYADVGECDVRNLFALNVPVVEGDSGSIVYAGTQAVGVIVAHARDSGWAWFHALEAGLKHLGRLKPQLPIQCFSLST